MISFLTRLAGCGGVLLFVFSSGVHAQWGPDTKLSTNEVSASLIENQGQCIFANGQALHVVWTDYLGTGSSAIFYKRSTDGGLTWGADTRLSGSPSSDSLALLAQSGSFVHLVFLRNSGTSGQAFSYYKRSSDGGTNWEPEISLGATKWWPGVAASSSTVYVSLNTLVTSSNSEVFFRRSTDNGTTWQPQVQISNANGRSEDPNIEATGSNVYLVWNDNRDGNMEVYYRRSLDKGLTWGAETSLTQSPDYTYMPAVWPLGSHVDVVYGDRISNQYYIHHLQSTDSGSTWGTEEAITQPPNNGFYPVIVRDGLNVHLAWTGTAGIMYQHSGNGGGSWEPAVSLVTQGSFPFIAVSGQTVHMIFVSQRSGHNAIYYKSNPTGNPLPPTLNIQQSSQSGFFDLTWYSVAGANYTIESTSNLLSGFEVLQNNILATPPLNTVTVSGSSSSCFYRLRF